MSTAEPPVALTESEIATHLTAIVVQVQPSAGKSLKALRENAGFTQAEAGKLIGLGKGRWCDFETGHGWMQHSEDVLPNVILRKFKISTDEIRTAFRSEPLTELWRSGTSPEVQLAFLELHVPYVLDKMAELAKMGSWKHQEMMLKRFDDLTREVLGRDSGDPRQLELPPNRSAWHAQATRSIPSEASQETDTPQHVDTPQDGMAPSSQVVDSKGTANPVDTSEQPSVINDLVEEKPVSE